MYNKVSEILSATPQTYNEYVKQGGGILPIPDEVAENFYRYSSAQAAADAAASGTSVDTGGTKNIFRKVIDWAKENPVKTTLIAVSTIALLTLAFSKKARTWLFGKKSQAQLTGYKRKK